MMVNLNFDAWCSIMNNISRRIWATDIYCVITLFFSIGTVQGSTDACICFFLVQIQLRHIYLLLPHHHSTKISCDLAILNTFLSTNFGAKRSEHQTSFIACTSWDLFWVTAGPRTIIDGKLQTLQLQGSLIPAHVAVGRWQLAKWPRYDLIWKILFLSILAAEL